MKDGLEPEKQVHHPLLDFGQALDRLSEALSRDSADDSLVLDAAIQRFEFCMDLAWKTLKKYLISEGLEANTPRRALQKAYAAKWIDSEGLWVGR